MEIVEKQLAQLERQHKYVTYKLRMYAVSDVAKFFFEERIADFEVFYPEKYIDEKTLLRNFAHQLEVAGGMNISAMPTSKIQEWYTAEGRIIPPPKLQYEKDYEFEVLEKIVHGPPTTLWDEIKPLKKEENEEVEVSE